MTSVNRKISAEARELLAANYVLHKMPWFAAVVLNENLKQFKVALEVITEVLQPKEN